MNPIDQAVVDVGIDYIRYVDDMRFFCADVPACKKALMFLIRELRRRGLNLQTAKTEIVSAHEERDRIESVTRVLASVHQKYKEFLEAMLEDIGPYATITDIEENVSADDAPVEVVREAFKNNFIDTGETFNKTLFHFLLKRLGAQKDPYAVSYCLRQFKTRPQETQQILDYLGEVGNFDDVFPALESFLNSADCIYDYQIYQVFQWLTSLGVPPSSGLVTIARRLTFDNARPSYLRAVCRTVLQKKAQLLISIALKIAMAPCTRN
jgi:hypothetical protein